MEPAPRPLRPAAFKVGESLAEIGSHYFAEVLGLRDNLRQKHLRKMGLRMFFGSGAEPIDRRPEVGYERHAPFENFQIDRGVLEQDLRGLVEQAGARLLERSAVESVELGSGGAAHRARLKDGTELSCRWLIDATGRRRLLQRKLGLGAPSGHSIGAAWLRVRGRLDLEDWSGDRTWLARVPERQRYHSTNHLMGEGYWVWLIGLGSGHTSVGLVAEASAHPFAGYSSREGLRSWLARHEPVLGRALEGAEPLDFMGLEDCSYHSRRVLSPERWACVGVAGVFADPLYSPGSDLIGILNGMVARCVTLDLEGRLDARLVDAYDSAFLGYTSVCLDNYRGAYRGFGSGRMMGWKMVWDSAVYWAFPAQFFVQGLFDAAPPPADFMAAARRYTELHARVQRFFRAWAAKKGDRPAPPFLETLAARAPLMLELQRDLSRRKTPEQAVADVDGRLRQFEEWARDLERDAAL